ncbi:MAG: protein kinase [Ardenticatenaceae bacterium]|nr:protein kinase [Ardenticatenaceae bacterium]
MESENLIGRQIDQYRIKSLLARGGMAEVFIAQDVNLNREVVLKVMLATLARDQSFATRFRREAQTTAQLNHPNIIQVYGAGFTPGGRPYLAMQYVRGGSLQDWLGKLAQQGRRLATADSLKIVSQIADALNTAHESGIIHRDLKPSNILLHPNGTPVLTDLGIAAVRTELTRLTQTGSVVGTPQYMSPEQAMGKSVDGRSDIYSLGIILYQLLAGQAPFAADSPVALLHQHVHELPPPLIEIRPDLAPATYRTVDICLQKEPKYRFQTAAQLVVALQNAAVDEGLRTPTAVPTYPNIPQPSPDLPTTAVTRKRPPGWVIATAVLLLLAVLFGLYQWLRPDGQPVADNPLPPIVVTSIVTPLSPATIIVTPTPQPEAIVPTDTAVPPTDAPLPTNTIGVTAVPALVTANVTAPRLNSPANIDGILSDWPAILPVASAFNVYAQSSWDGSDDVEAYWLLGWDANNLYVAVTVVDDIHVQIKSDEKIYQGDSIEIQIDTDLAGDYGTIISPDDYQINMSPGDFQTVPKAFFIWRANDSGRYEAAPWRGILLAAQPTNSGYTMEAQIPWENLNMIPSPGQQIGIALNVSDNDSVGTAVQEMMKSNVETRTYEAPYTWGTLTLYD